MKNSPRKAKVLQIVPKRKNKSKGKPKGNIPPQCFQGGKTLRTKSYSKDLKTFIKSIEQRSLNFKNPNQGTQTHLGSSWDTKRIIQKIEENPAGNSSESYMRILQGLTMNKQQPKKTLGANKSNFSLKTLDILGSRSPEKRTLENHNVDEPYFSTITKNLEMNTPVKKASAKLKPLDLGYCSSTERSLSFPEHIYKLRKLEEKQTDLNDLSSAFSYLQSPIGCSPTKRMILSNQESPQKKGKTSRFLYSEVKEGLKPQLYQNTPKKKLYKLPEKLSQIVKKPVKDPVRKVKNTKRRYCLNSLKIQGIKDP